MAENQSIAARAERVSRGLIAIEQLCRAARLAGSFDVVDLRAFFFDVGLLAGEIEGDAVRVAAALQGARLVTFRVIE